MKSRPDTDDPSECLIAADHVEERWSVSGPTLWRREQKGLLTPINVFGRKYYKFSEVRGFEERAISGEFASPPRGAAAAKAARKKLKEASK